jgi:hypothetical protein
MKETRWWHLGPVLKFLAIIIIVRAGVLIAGYEVSIPLLDPVFLLFLGWAKSLGQLILPI